MKTTILSGRGNLTRPSVDLSHLTYTSMLSRALDRDDFYKNV